MVPCCSGRSSTTWPTTSLEEQDEARIYAAKRVLELISVVYHSAKEHDIISLPNPAEDVQAYEEKKRKRRQATTELKSFLDAVKAEGNETVRDFVYMSLLTGARKSNVLAMRWENIDFIAAEWYIPETKNGHEAKGCGEGLMIGCIDSGVGRDARATMAS